MPPSGGVDIGDACDADAPCRTPHTMPAPNHPCAYTPVQVSDYLEMNTEIVRMLMAAGADFKQAPCAPVCP